MDIGVSKHLTSTVLRIISSIDVNGTTRITSKNDSDITKYAWLQKFDVHLLKLPPARVGRLAIFVQSHNLILSVIGLIHHLKRHKNY